MILLTQKRYYRAEESIGEGRDVQRIFAKEEKLPRWDFREIRRWGERGNIREASNDL